MKGYGMAGTCSMLAERRMFKMFGRKGERKDPLGRPRHGRPEELAQTVTFLTGIQKIVVSDLGRDTAYSYCDFAHLLQVNSGLIF
jgi:hypothetical protein